MPDVFLVPFPKQAQSVLSIFEVFNVNIGGLSLPLSCIGLGTFWERMFFTLIFPIALAVFILVGSMVYAFTIRMKTGEKDAKKSLLAGGLLALPKLLLLSFLVFPMVSSTAFQAFSCETFDSGDGSADRSFLLADFAIECGTPEHHDVQNLAWIGILLYPVGISGLYIILFRKANRAILNERPTALSRALGFLTLDFEKEWYPWELFEAS